MATDDDVIIIGGGVAGVTALRELRHNGPSSNRVEYPRPGGDTQHGCC